ncbi:MAG: glycosyltransferase [candidate division Zixibacteria bacterium]|nr:glycosyltransferase [Gammaproteobacteria bacterium]NIX55822.1 glycosyltransferase [candidate division Zixibacteria bacterium]
MRIAIFTETFLPKVDGIVVKVCRLLEHLEARGHTALVFAPSGSPKEHAGAKVISFRSLPIPFYPELNISPPWAIVDRKLREFKPDLIHLVNPVSLGLAGLRAAKLYQIPVIASYHTDVPGFAEHWKLGFLSDSIYRYARWIHNKVDLNVCPSEFTRKQLYEHNFQRVEIWRGGVDIKLYSPKKRTSETRNRLSDHQPERPLLLYVGRVSPEKRIDRLHPILKAYPEARLAVVGDGPSRKDLQKKFADTDTVFTGYLQGEMLASAYASGDIFAFTGDKETFGNVVVEAMASGLPVLAPNSGGVTDLVIDRFNGRQYDPYIEGNIVEVVGEMINDRNLARDYGLKGRELAEGRTWEITLDELLCHYQNVIQTDRPKRRFKWLIWERGAIASELNEFRERWLK